MFGIDDALLLSAGTSIVGGLLNKKKGGGSPAQTDVVTMPQYSFTEPRLKLASDFISSNLQRVSEGKFPAYYDAASPYIKSSLQRPLDQTYFGTAGNRSTSSTNVALQASAALGTGARAGTAQVNKAMQRYEDASKAIDEFIQKTGVDITQQSVGQMLTASNQMPKGPDAQVVSYGGQAPPQQNGITDALSSIAGSIPWLTGKQGANNPLSLAMQPMAGMAAGYGASGSGSSGASGSWGDASSSWGSTPAPTSFSSFISSATQGLPGMAAGYGMQMGQQIPAYLKQLLGMKG